MYESDITKFMRDLMQADPTLVELQKQNRATWWDKVQDSDAAAEHAASAAPKQAYAYFPLPQAVIAAADVAIDADARDVAKQG